MRELNFGQTPWDDCSREDMLRELQRFYSACLSMRSALALLQPQHGPLCPPFWDLLGTAGRALAKGDQALEKYEPMSEDIYRAFFRYADDLLFEGVGSNWRVCERGHMLARLPDEPPPTSCTICEHEMGRGPSPMRPLVWADLEPSR